MKLQVTDSNYKRIWLKLIVDFKLGIHLSEREYDVLELLFKYTQVDDVVSTRNKVKLSDDLDISLANLHNILKKLKDKKLINKETNKPLFPMISLNQVLKEGINLNFNLNTENN